MVVEVENVMADSLILRLYLFSSVMSASVGCSGDKAASCLSHIQYNLINSAFISKTE